MCNQDGPDANRPVALSRRDATITSVAEVQADFDRIALLADDEWNHNSHYHAFLLKRVPARCAQALEVGCGTGGFARLLAQRAERVLALDLAPQMIRVARDRAKHLANIEFQVADAATWQFPAERFDCIVSIATLHHLPLGEMLDKIKRSLTPNGVLLVLDLFRAEGLADDLASTLAAPVARTGAGARCLGCTWAPRLVPLVIRDKKYLCGHSAGRCGDAALAVALFHHLEKNGTIGKTSICNITTHSTARLTSTNRY